MANKTPPSLEAEGLSQSVCRLQGRGCSPHPPLWQPDPSALTSASAGTSRLEQQHEENQHIKISQIKKSRSGCWALAPECESVSSLPDVSGLTVETFTHTSSSSQQHGIFPKWSDAGWIPRRSQEEVMTQEGAKPARRRAQFNTLLRLFAHRQGDFFCFSNRSPRKSGLQNKVLE